MVDEETNDLIEDGIIEPDEVEDFENLDPELQDLVEAGEITLDEAQDIDS